MNDPQDDLLETLLRRSFDGPVRDDGFTDRLMRDLPPRRRRIAWPLWLGLLIGSAACWLSLLRVPALLVGWRDGLAGELSSHVIGLWLVMGLLALLAVGWSWVDGGNR